MQEHSSIGMSGGQGKDQMYLSRELVVHPALGMDTDHPLRCAVDVVAEVKTVFLCTSESAKESMILAPWQVALKAWQEWDVTQDWGVCQGKGDVTGHNHSLIKWKQIQRQTETLALPQVHGSKTLNEVEGQKEGKIP